MVGILLALGLSAGPLAESFPFVLPVHDGSATYTDLSFLSREPAGQSGRLALRDGRFVDGAGRRVRFLGTNVTFAGAFPTHEVADKTAARMRKFGLNIVRFHHMDNRTKPGGIWLDAAQTALDPEQLDRLDYFISRLKAAGIYANLNLHVSRNYAGVNWKDVPDAFRYGKIIDHYHPAMLEQQKQYATLLLSHRNPYTNSTYATEPAVAVIELNNENTLVGHAFDSNLLALPANLLQPLLDGWHAWLQRKYGTLDKVRSAWLGTMEPLGAEMLANGDLSQGSRGWTLEAPRPAEATLAVAAGAGPEGAPALRAVMTRPGEQQWHFQVHHRDLDLREGRTYTVEFWARADRARRISVGVRLQEPDWRHVGLNAGVDLTPSWRRYRFVFIAANPVPQKTRLSFNNDNQPGTVEIARVSLRPGVALETTPGGISDLPAPVRSGLPNERRDWVTFLMDVERQYVTELKRHVREVVGAQAPVICSQASYGGVAGVVREGDLSDYIDMHAYWQHPRFPRKAWDANDWTIGNRTMTEEPDGGTLMHLAAYRLAGRAYTVSEYDHPAPSFHSAEMFPLIGAYAAQQDWDAVYQFDYGTVEDPARGDRLNGYFSMSTHPAKMAFAPVAAMMLRGGLVPPAATSTVLEVPRDAAAELLAQGRGDLAALWRVAGAPPGLFAQSRLAVRLVPGSGAPRLIDPPAADSPPSAVRWHAQPKEQSHVLVVAPQVVAAVGKIAGRAVSAGPLTIDLAATARRFASTALVSLDGRAIEQSRKLLLVVCGAVLNQDMGWNDTFTTVGRNWGKGPTVAEALAGAVRLQTGVAGLKVAALDGTGAPGATVASALTNGELAFRVEPSQRTMWYAISAP